MKRWICLLLAALLLLTPAMALEQPTDEDIRTVGDPDGALDRHSVI